VQALRQANSDIAAHSRSAVLELYALESRLARAERLIARLEAQQAAVQHREQLAEERLRIARRAADVAEQQLEQRLRALYIQGDVDPLAMLLGAESLDDALSTLDHLNSLAEQDREILRQTQVARANLRSALRTLAARQRELASLTRAAKAARASLVRAKNERTAYLAQLAKRRRMNQSAIAALTAQAQRAEQKAAELASTSFSGSSTSSGGTVSGHEVTVVATGYSLQGTTATGVPAGWGVVAVDPSVIPLGTKMTIPGYGEGVAADTGSAVVGNMIDLWFPTTEQALAWGRQEITITLH
jgi:3D (Asp-Asp-Asp) domain-containing protein